MADKEATELTAQQKLEQYNKALKEEFDVPASELSQEDITFKTRAAIIKTIVPAVAQIATLAETAESEQTRLSAAKFLVEHGLGVKGKATANDNPMGDLLKKLAENDGKES